jgi:copper chaperone CopZ
MTLATRALLALVGACAVGVSCMGCDRSADAAPPPAAKAKPAEVTLRISGMTCAGCASSAEQALRRLDGVRDVMISLEHERASVTYFPDRVTPTKMIEAVASVGYDASIEPSR